jgi:hypothetical protein
MTDADSRPAGSYTWFLPQNGINTVRLVGGTQVTGWTAVGGGVYKAPCSTPVYTMFENGVRARAGRLPKLSVNASYPCSQAPWFFTTASGTDDSYLNFGYSTSDWDPTGLTAANLSIYSQGVPGQWFTETTPVSSFDTVGHTVTLAHQARQLLRDSASSAFARYIAQGDVSFVTQPGEFHWDSGTNYLYYYPVNGNPNTNEIAIPNAQDVVTLTGASTSALVKGIIFDSLWFDISDFTSWYRYAQWGVHADNDPPPADPPPPGPHAYPEYGRQYSGSTQQHGLFNFQNVSGVTIQKCHISNAGYSGVYARNYAKAVSISNCWIEHTGHSSIHMEGNFPGENDTVRDWTVSNCKLRNFGELVGHGSGLYISNAGNSTWSHLDIQQGIRHGIFVTAWTNTIQAAVYATNNAFDHIYIDGVMQGSGDGGAVSTAFLSSLTGGPYNVNTWNQIRIGAVLGIQVDGRQFTDTPPDGVYFDTETHGQQWSNTWVTNAQNGQEREFSTGDMVFSNVSWVGGFNSGLMDPVGNPSLANNIGLGPGFPY